MKKILTMLFLLVIVTGSVMAEPSLSNKVTLKATVGSVEPKFELLTSLTGSFTDAVIGDQEISTGKDLTEGPSLNVAVSASFKLRQTNTSRHAGVLKVTLTPSQFTTKIDETTYSTDTINVFTTNHFTDSEALTFRSAYPSFTVGKDANQYEATFTYLNGHKVVADDLLVVTFQWEKKDNLPAGNYNATVVVSIAPEG